MKWCHPRMCRSPLCRSQICHAMALLLLVIVGIVPAAAQQAQTLKVAQTQWGFDGRVVTGEFNPLSLLVDNLSDQPIEGQVTLRPVSGMVRESGALFSEPLYLAPNTRRWIQFYPYVAHASDTWRLTIRTPQKILHTETLDTPRSVFGFTQNEAEDTRQVVAVILDRPGMATREPTSVKHMPAEIFPPWSTATCALRVLFLDHVPDWELPRQQALLSWLKRGGQLHLLQDLNGQALQFSGLLAPLNEPFQSFSVGHGSVTRHELQRNQLSDTVVRPIVRRPDPDSEADQASQATNPQAPWTNLPIDPAGQDNDFLTRMRELTQPEHAWWLIFLLSLSYIGLIFPGCWILSQKRTLHYLATYGAIAGLAILFSLLFLLIGRRGYGETTVMNSLTVARAEDELHWNTLQWSTLFVVSGNDYQISSSQQEALLASGNTDEAVDAIIGNGSNAVFDTRIPPFSSQSVISRRRVKLPDWELSVVSAEVSGTALSQLVIAAGKQFPRGSDCRYQAVYLNRLYGMTLSQDGSQLISGPSQQLLSEYCSIRPEVNMGTFFLGRQMSAADKRTPAERFYEQSLPMLVERSLMADGVEHSKLFSIPPNQVRLLVYAPSAELMHLAVSASTRMDGRTLFVRDLRLSTDP